MVSTPTMMDPEVVGQMDGIVLDERETAGNSARECRPHQGRVGRYGSGQAASSSELAAGGGMLSASIVAGTSRAALRRATCSLATRVAT